MPLLPHVRHRVCASDDVVSALRSNIANGGGACMCHLSLYDEGASVLVLVRPLQQQESDINNHDASIGNRDQEGRAEASAT